MYIYKLLKCTPGLSLQIQMQITINMVYFPNTEQIQKLTLGNIRSVHSGHGIIAQNIHFCNSTIVLGSNLGGVYEGQGIQFLCLPGGDPDTILVQKKKSISHKARSTPTVTLDGYLYSCHHHQIPRAILQKNIDSFEYASNYDLQKTSTSSS